MKECKDVLSICGKNGENIERSGVESAVKQPKESQDSGGAASGIHLGLELATSVGVGSGLGIFLDKWLGTSPFLLVAGLFLGCVAGFLAMIRGSQGKRGAEKVITINESDGQT